MCEWVSREELEIILWWLRNKIKWTSETQKMNSFVGMGRCSTRYWLRSSLADVSRLLLLATSPQKAIIVINTWYNRDYLASTDALVRKCPFLQRLIDANAGGCLQASECAWLSAISAVVPYLPLHRVSISLINWLTDWDTEQVRRISTQCFFKFRVLKSLNGTRKTIFHFL